LLTTGHLSSRHPLVVGAGDVSWGSRPRGGRKRGRWGLCTLGVYSFGLILVSARTNKRHHHLKYLELGTWKWGSPEYRGIRKPLRVPVDDSVIVIIRRHLHRPQLAETQEFARPALD
jgi:hypothetical protein